jgi:2-methylcitrate dehydratase
VRRPDTIRLWRKITTVEDEEWNRRYDDLPPLERDHGCRAVITSRDGSRLVDEIAVANAHPRGARPFGHEDYVRKYLTLADGIVEPAESERFLDLVRHLPDLLPAEVAKLNVSAHPRRLGKAGAERRGIF